MIKSISLILYLTFFIHATFAGRLIYRIVVYPEIFDPYSRNLTTYVASNNLLPMLQIYDNGTLISVGTRDKLMDVQNDDVDRVIWKLNVEGGNVTWRMQEFYNIVNHSGFFMQASYGYNNYNKSNKICDTFFPDSSNYEVCILKGNTTPAFDEIREAIKRIFLTSYTSVEFYPTQFFVSTAILPRYSYYKKVNHTTRSRILSEFDPDEIYFKGDYSTSCWVHTSLFAPVSPFIDAVNKHRIYNDSYTIFRFIIWIPELSFTNIPFSTRTTAFTGETLPYPYPPYSSWMSDIEPSSYNRPNEFLIISICLIVILFISLCVAFIIRRARMKKLNQTDNTELFNNYASDSEVVSDELDKIPQPVQTSYPIFVSTNPMQVNPQPYPIFVTTNPMPTNPQMTNPIVFPQPTLFYPQTTNQN